MKTSPSLITLLAAALVAGLAATAQAADIVKTNNADALNTTTSWVGGVVPTSTDVAVFDSTLDGSFNSYAIGGAMTWGGISFRDAATDQTIATSTTVLSLTNGSPGIDMTAAAIANFNIGCRLNLGTSGGQVFNVENSDRTLTVSGIISGTGPLTKTGAGLLKVSTLHTYTGGTVISEGTLQLGSANTLPAGDVTVQSGATLDLNTFWLTNKAYTVRIAGTGVTNGGALVHNASGQINVAVTNLVLDADASIGGVGRFDVRSVPQGTISSSVNLGANTLTKIRGNQVFFQQTAPITNGNIVVESGMLGLTQVTMTNGSSTLRVKNGAELRLFRNGSFASSLIACPMILEAGATLSHFGAETGDAIDQSLASAITLTGDATINQSNVVSTVFELAGPITGSAGLAKIGRGTVLLSGASTYGGATTVSGGALALSTAWSGSGAVTVNDGASFEVRQSAPSATLKVNSLTLGSSAGPTTNTLSFGGFGNPTNPVVNVTNALTLNGTATLNLADTAGLTAGTFKLFAFGSLAGTGGFQVGAVSGFTAILATNGNSIEVTIQPATLAWRGAVAGGNWLLSTPETNWLNLLLNAPAAFTDGAPVVFDDSLTGTPTVNIAETVQPSSVIVSNVATNYTFSGAGRITGATGLTKTGAGTLNVGVANDYSGATTIAGGTLQLGITHAIPTNTVAVVVNNSGTLDLNGNNQTVMGLNGNGTVTNTSATPAELRIGAGSAAIFSGLIADDGSGNLTLFKTGGGYQTLTGNNTFSGGTSMNGGSLRLGSDGALGYGPLSLSFTAQVSSDSSTPRSITNDLNFTGGSSKSIGDAVNNGVLTCSGTVGFGGGSRNVSFNSDVVISGTAGNGALVKEGPGKLTMNGVNTCTGTTMNGGTLAGSGSFSGPVAINAATLSPGSGIGTLTMSSTLTLGANSTTYMELNAASGTNDLVSGLASVTYGGTLQVTNLSGTLTSGQTFQLFSATTPDGSFAATNLPALAGGLAWNWDAASGTLSVVPGMATTPTNITFSVSGGTLNLTWPASHLGWIAQSNSVSLVNTNFWVDIAGSDLVTNLSYSINTSLTNVFYRLRKP